MKASSKQANRPTKTRKPDGLRVSLWWLTEFGKDVDAQPRSLKVYWAERELDATRWRILALHPTFDALPAVERLRLVQRFARQLRASLQSRVPGHPWDAARGLLHSSVPVARWAEALASWRGPARQKRGRPRKNTPTYNPERLLAALLDRNVVPGAVVERADRNLSRTLDVTKRKLGVKT